MMTEQPPPVPIPVEKPQAESLLATTIILVVLHGVVMILLIFVLIFVIPKFRDIFASFDVELPVITVIMLNVSHLAKKYALLLPFVLGSILAVDGFVYYSLRRHTQPIWSHLWGIVVVMLEGAAVLGIVLAVFLPLVTLMTQVGSSG